jgi:voltage-gated potassium channel
MNSQRYRLRVYMAVFLIVMLTGTVGFSLLEKFPLADAFYFTIVTIATVGYGDIHPMTPAGKFLSIFLIVFGVGTFMAALASGMELMLNRREKAARLNRLNRVIGVFFGQIGTRLLALFVSADPDVDTLENELVVRDTWTDTDLDRVKQVLASHPHRVKVSPKELQELDRALREGMPLILHLFQNPNLVEHESFSDLLHAVLHLAEELAAREDLTRIPDNDCAHLEGDIRRAYTFLVREWLHYIFHLKEHYPYLFSLAMRTNPFDRAASPTIQ